MEIGGRLPDLAPIRADGYVDGNTEAMNLHLAEIATAVEPAAHAILLVDQAGWHISMPANLTIITLPASCLSDCANGRTSSDQWDSVSYMTGILS
jgi:putative transposase